MLPTITNIFRISRPLELKYTKDGIAFGSVGLVAGERYKEKETTLWMNATAWRKTAELLATVPKGARVLVKGKLSTDSYEKEGIKKQSTLLTVESFEFVEKRSDVHNDNVDRDYKHNVAGAIGRPTRDQEMATDAIHGVVPGVDVDMEEIPFNQGVA